MIDDKEPLDALAEASGAQHEAQDLLKCNLGGENSELMRRLTVQVNVAAAMVDSLLLLRGRGNHVA